MAKVVLASAIAGLALMAPEETQAQAGWSSADEWRADYQVGDKIRLSISGNQSDFQTCTVSENDPNSVMRARCEAFKYWSAGDYVASRNFVRPMPAPAAPAAEAPRPQAPAAAPPGGAAPDGWTASDGWRSAFKVGQPIRMSISGRPEDVQTCTVTENEPTSVLRALCNRFKEWRAGEQMVSEFQVRATTGVINPPTQARAPAGYSTGLKIGEYACTGSGGRMMIGMGFKVVSANRYTDLSGGRSGTFTVTNGNVTFNGGHMQGVSGRNLHDNWFTIASAAKCGPYR